MRDMSAHQRQTGDGRDIGPCARALRAARLAAGKSQRTAALEAGKSHAAWVAYEGADSPLDNARRLFDTLAPIVGVTATELFEGTSR